jgi:hypothetical protein
MWRPSYSWAACRGKYGASSDEEALTAVAEAGDVSCINALFDRYPAVVILHDRPDVVAVQKTDSGSEVHICYAQLCVVIHLIEAAPGAEDEEVSEAASRREQYAVLNIFVLRERLLKKTRAGRSARPQAALRSSASSEAVAGSSPARRATERTAQS